MAAFTRHDAQALAAAVTAAGGRLPAVLTRLLDAAEKVRSSDPEPADPMAGLLDAAATGKATPATITAAISAVSTQSAEAEHTARAQADAERAIYTRFRRELADGAADAILDSLRPAFAKHIAGVRAIAEGIDLNVSAEQFLTTATPETLALWQAVASHPGALDRIAAVCDLLTHTAPARLLDLGAEFSAGENVNRVSVLGGVELFCVTGIDAAQARAIRRTNTAGRGSAWFRLYSVAELGTVATARERLRSWCESAWDAEELARPPRFTGDTQDRRRPNPFRIAEPAL